eukprot:2250574-Ditylum_brightwellii.AAC.1
MIIKIQNHIEVPTTNCNPHMAARIQIPPDQQPVFQRALAIGTEGSVPVAVVLLPDSSTPLPWLCPEAVSFLPPSDTGSNTSAAALAAAAAICTAAAAAHTLLFWEFRPYLGHLSQQKKIYSTFLIRAG